MATSTTRKTTRKPATTKRKTTPRSSSAAKATAAPKAKTAAPKAAPAAAAPKPASETAPIPKVVKLSEPTEVKADLKKKELLEAVVAKSGVKKKDAKPVVEAMLSILGDTLAEGRELNLQPLGKVRINRAEEHTNHRIVICKLRQQLKSDLSDEKQPLAEGQD